MLHIFMAMLHIFLSKHFLTTINNITTKIHNFISQPQIVLISTKKICNIYYKNT